ncbi:hypothetical protein [Bifidobacterium xylocopae]|uniref:Uncharacterized protein n=1 Tax=Bifidobacterium xylocopae TaxID=2493119 RepID=A0A366KED1_9BIFI|nr:hypothetical protein [Bifidobacterium xylocopae]RBQ00055.1 hypothetical protein CRD59_00915 [Bifidobacterium xylocopae]
MNVETSAMDIRDITFGRIAVGPVTQGDIAVPGIKVTRKNITHWIERGQMPSLKSLEEGWYEFSIGELVALAEKLDARRLLAGRADRITAR